MVTLDSDPRGKESSGKLTPKALRKALFLVESNRFVGNIHVSRADEEKHIYFTVGGIRLLSAGARRKSPLGKLLVRYGKLTPPEMREALQTQKRTGRRIGDVLTNVLKFCEASDIEEVVQVQVENEIFDVITWMDGVYEYAPSMPDALFNKKLKATTLSTDIPSLIERIKSRIDRWPDIHQKVPDLQGIYRLTRTGHRRVVEDAEAGPEKKELGSLLDGSRTLNKVIEKGEFGTFETWEMVADFLDQDCVAKVGGSAEAGSLADQTDVFEEIQMLERALELNPGDEAVRTRLVEALEKGGVRDRAGLHLRSLAEQRIREGKGDEAQALLIKATKLNPTDFDGQELLFEVYVASGEKDKAAQHGLRLAEMYKANRLFNRTKKILTKILEWEPQSIKGHTLLAETHEDLMESQSAVKEYETVAAILKEGGKDESRLKVVYELILQIDDRDRNARKELNRLLRKGQRKFTDVLRLAALVLFAVAAFGTVGYEFAGCFLYGEARAEVLRRTKKKDFEGARAKLDSFRSRFPIVASGALDKAALEIEKRRLQHGKVEILRFTRVQEAVLKNPTPSRLEATAARISKKLQEDELPPEGPARAHLADLLARIQKILVPWNNIVSTAKSGKSEKAFTDYLSLMKAFPAFQAAGKVPSIPLPFEVQPRGAQIALDGTSLPPGAELLSMKMGKKHDIQVSHPGYQTLNMQIELAGAAWPLVLTLTKEVVWKTDLGGPVTAPALVRGNEVFVPSLNRSMICLDLESGSVKWRFWTGLGGDMDSAPLLDGEGHLFFCARDATLYGLEAGSNRPRIRYELGSPGAHSPLIYEDKGVRSFLLALGDGTVILVPIDEKRATRTLFRTGKRILAGLAEFQGIVVVGDVSGHVLAFDLVAGRLKWEAQLDRAVTVAPTIHEGTAFLGTGGGKLYALDLTEGAILPQWPCNLDSASTSRPVVHGDLILIGTENGQIVAVDRMKGKPVWRFQAEGPIRASPVVSGRTVYVGSDDRHLYAVDLQSRAVRWKFETGGPVRAAPILTGGMVLFGSGDGSFYAIKE